MPIIGTIMTVIVFGLLISIWILSLHLDELTALFVKFLYLTLMASAAFLLFGVFRKWL